jgi:hypothetical protein
MSDSHEPNKTTTSSPPSIILILQELEDPRVKRTRKHHLTDILFISLCAVICGCESFEDMEEFGIAKEEWFRRYLELPNGIPSHDTFNRVYQFLDPFAFQDCLIRWTQGVREMISGEIVAIDGKAQRRARNKNANLHYIVNAWAGENRLLLGQHKVTEKSNEWSGATWTGANATCPEGVRPAGRIKSPPCQSSLICSIWRGTP